MSIVVLTTVCLSCNLSNIAYSHIFGKKYRTFSCPSALNITKKSEPGQQDRSPVIVHTTCMFYGGVGRV